MLSFDTFLQDLKHSLRMFRQNHGFTTTAVAALTLGIGLNTAAFSVTNAVLLKPVPFQDPDRLVRFQNTSPQAAGRLKRGVTLEQAKARMQLSAEEFRAKFPNAIPKDNGFTVQPVKEAVVSNVR